MRAGRVSTDRGFTGQRREGGSRLGAYFYNARFYATGLGHFLSADTVSTDGLDRYAYAGFDPVRYADPSGHVRPEEGGSCETICQWQAAWAAFHPEQAAHGGSGGGGGSAPGCDAGCLQTIAGLMECAANYDACTHSGAGTACDSSCYGGTPSTPPECAMYGQNCNDEDKQSPGGGGGPSDCEFLGPLCAGPKKLARAVTRGGEALADKVKACNWAQLGTGGALIVVGAGAAATTYYLAVQTGGATVIVAEEVGQLGLVGLATAPDTLGVIGGTAGFSVGAPIVTGAAMVIDAC